MRKILYLIAVFFLLSSCKNVDDNIKKETLIIELPKWPPQNNLIVKYPNLSRWKITIKSQQYNKVFFTTNNSLKIEAVKYQPLAIIAEPITLNSENKEVIFFKPAGFLYPYNTEEEITWNNGFLASIMISLFQSNSTNLENVSNFINSFNWKKAIRIINEKLELEQTSYNPWLLNRELILRKISEKNFSSVYLNLSSTYFINPIDFNIHYIISSFPPSNNSSLLLLKKSQPQQFMITPCKTATITYNSSKNVSLDYNYLPILIEGL